MQTISRVFLLIWFVLLVRDAVPTTSMLARPLNLEEVVEIIATDETTDENDVVIIDKIGLEEEDQSGQLQMPQPDIIPRIVNNPDPSGLSGGYNPDPPGTWREAAPVTTETFVTLELSPETNLFGRPGDIVNVIFYLSNLGSSSQMVFVNVNEFGSNGTPRLDVKLPRRKINLGVNDKQSISIQLSIPSYYPNLPSQKLISLEVQPKGNTLSGKKTHSAF